MALPIVDQGSVHGLIERKSTLVIDPPLLINLEKWTTPAWPIFFSTFWDELRETPPIPDTIGPRFDRHDQDAFMIFQGGWNTMNKLVFNEDEEDEDEELKGDDDERFMKKQFRCINGWV